MKRNQSILFVALAALLLTGPRAGANDETNAPSSRLDLQSFRIISDRNIFDPNRSPRTVRTPRTTERAPRTEYFALVGTMSYEKVLVAFFDGSGSEYRRTVKPADMIGGYQVTEITPNQVKLTSTNSPPVNMQVGMQLKRQDGGEWSLSARTETAASALPTTTSTATGKSAGPAPGGNSAADEIMRRLMERRAQESK